MMRLNLRKLAKPDESVPCSLASFTPRDLDWNSVPLCLSSSAASDATDKFCNFDVLQSLTCGVQDARQNLLEMNLRLFRIQRLYKQIQRYFQQLEAHIDVLRTKME